jgi:Permuted papain-like amidase enzyme, YaeF/YiiX, C92 family
MIRTHSIITIALSVLFICCNNTAPSSTAALQPVTEPLILTQDPATGQSGYRTVGNTIAIAPGKYEQCLTDTFRTHAIVMTRADHQWVVIDRKEAVQYAVFPFDNGPDYPSEGLFRIVKDGKIGYADAITYTIVIPPQYGCAYPFENGKAKVSRNCQTTQDGEHSTWTSDSWEYIDKTGAAQSAAAAQDVNPQLQNGDLIFQTSMTDQSKAVQLATHSKYSHCGIIYQDGSQYYVFEAVQPVKRTPLQEWINHGKDGHYVVKRLKNADAVLTPEVLKKMKQEGDKFNGKNYDLTFEWSDDKIYCSELIWKVYQRATGIEIGKPGTLSSFDLSSDVVKKKMKERYGNHIPMNEKVISPAAVFESELLKVVVEQ